jgi:hypothetical protein
MGVSGLNIDESSPGWMNDLCQIVDDRRVSDGVQELDWTNDNPSTGFIRYARMGETEFQESDTDDTPSQSHRTTLSGLDLDEIYFARAVAYDQSRNNLTISKEYVFDTNTGAGTFAVMTDIDTVFVAEGQTAEFSVRLSAEPIGTVEVVVAHVDGDADISVISGALLTFSSGNWDEYQLVTLGAAEDVDHENGRAGVIIYATGTAIYRVISVAEIDNDENRPGAALASSGVLIYPMPFRPDQGSLAFEDLPVGGSVDIFDLRGRQVWSGNAPGQTQLTWSGNNLNSATVTSGRYFVVVRDSGGGVVEKRAILIVR